jgi:hypothetical protein
MDILFDSLTERISDGWPALCGPHRRLVAMNQTRRIIRTALLIAALTLTIGLTPPSVAASASAARGTDVAHEGVEPLVWKRSTHAKRTNCVKIKKLLERLWGYATLPMTDTCYHDQHGWYFYWWDKD